MMLYEVYEDDAAFQAHWSGPSVARHREEAGDMLLKVSGVRLTPVE
jgi:quinol monooxygenase YgiN